MNNDNFKKHEEWLEEKDIMIFSYCRKKDEQCNDRHGELLLFVFNVNIMSSKDADDNVQIV